MTILEQFKQSCNTKKSLSLYSEEAKCWEARQAAYKQLISFIGKHAVLKHQKLIKSILDKAEDNTLIS